MNNEAQAWLRRRAMQGAPFEVCGFILEGDELVEIRNISLAPARAFKMDRNQMVEKLTGRVEFITGIWHTHPKGSIHPSHTDLDGIKCGVIQRNWDYYIVTADCVSLYQAGHYAPPVEPVNFWNQFSKV